MKSIILQQKAELDMLLGMNYQERFAMAQAVSYRDSKPINGDKALSVFRKGVSEFSVSSFD